MSLDRLVDRATAFGRQRDSRLPTIVGILTSDGETIRAMCQPRGGGLRPDAPFVIAIIFQAMLWLLLYWTRIGNYVIAIGGNKDARPPADNRRAIQ